MNGYKNDKRYKATSLLAQLTSELERIHQKRTCAVRREFTKDTDSMPAPEYTYRVYIHMAHALPI